MAYNYAQSDLAKQAKKELDAINNQVNNFGSTFQYDPSKDEGLQKVKSQLESDANVLASKERGRMGNRIGARSSWEDAVSSSVLAEAQKNYSNLIPEYMQKAYDNAYNQLLNRQSIANQNFWNQTNFDMQQYAQQLAQENADRAYNYQVAQDKEANKIALAQAEAAKQQAINAAAQQAWEQQYKYDSLNAQYGTNYTSPSGTQSGSSNTGGYYFTTANISGLRDGAKDFIRNLQGEKMTESELRRLILDNAEEYDIEVRDIKNMYAYLGLDSSWVDNYQNAGWGTTMTGWGGKGIKLR